MRTLYKRLNRCDREIKTAAAECGRLHTEAEHAGILTWELDKRWQREAILAEIATQEQTTWERF